MTSAGVAIVQVVEILGRNAPSRGLRELAGHLKLQLDRGSTFTEAMLASGRHLPEFDIALIEAGEKSGRLDQCFRLLGDFYEERGRLVSKVLSELLYPAFLFHLAIIIFPPTLLADLVWKGEVFKFVISKLAALVPTYVAVFFILWAIQSERGRTWRAALEQFAIRIPMIGSTVRDLAMARLCAALEALINAGVTIIEAWDLASRASGSSRIIRAVAEAKPRMQRGELPSDCVAAAGVFPDVFVSSYKTGEMAGQLDETLRRLYRYFLELGSTGLHRLAEWIPRLVYFGILLGIGYFIISFWTNYFGQINQIVQ